jgi:hypothetical protein
MDCAVGNSNIRCENIAAKNLCGRQQLAIVHDVKYRPSQLKTSSAEIQAAHNHWPASMTNNKEHQGDNVTRRNPRGRQPFPCFHDEITNVTKKTSQTGRHVFHNHWSLAVTKKYMARANYTDKGHVSTIHWLASVMKI